MKEQDIKTYMANMPMPMCVIDSKGMVVAASESMNKVFLYGDVTGNSIFALTGRKYEDFYAYMRGR